MNLNGVFVCDIECDGLLDELTKLHVLSCAYPDGQGSWGIMSTNDKDKIQGLVGNPDNIIVGHHFVGFDKPALQKLGFDFNAQIIDTLGLSWYLYNERIQHGLADWGKFFGIPKPEIENWKDLSYEEYKHRCEEDVKINTNLWIKMLALLRELYDGDENAVVNVVKYFTFKMECLRIQEENKILIDIPKCEENLEILNGIIKEKESVLAEIMPQIPVKVKRKKPKTLYKQGPKRPKTMFTKTGELSKAGQNWVDALDDNDLPHDYEGDEIPNILSTAGEKWVRLMNRIKETNPDIDTEALTEIIEVAKYNPPNPSSTEQMKDYLLSLGWIPKFFKDGANGRVPQLKDDDKNLCPNIKKLFTVKPELEALDGLSVATHRAGYLKAFLKFANENGYAHARANGFAKTIRLKHANPFVNLPKPTALYGEYVRSVMVAPEGMVLIGSDVSSLEDKTKQIAIYDYDSEYVEQMNFPGWDAHLDIGQRANLLTSDEVEFFKWYKKKDRKDEDCPGVYKGMSEDKHHSLYNEVSKKRAVAKTVNYAATYGAGAGKIAESAGISQNEARKVLKAYWDRNWAVKQYADDRKMKEVEGKKWIFNPYSGLWLYLTSEHIKFSACNQNAGVKMFDLWVYFMIQEGLKPIAQFHDEVLLCVSEDEAEWVERTLHACMDKVNQCFDYPIKLEVDVAIGNSYAEVH